MEQKSKITKVVRIYLGTLDICSQIVTSIQDLLKYFTRNKKGQPHGGATGKSEDHQSQNLSLEIMKV